MQASPAINSGCNRNSRQGVKQCSEGRNLQLAVVAEAGWCQGCDRWVFGKEKVMLDQANDCYYCSTCAPEARDPSADHLWEDFLTTIGSALRDAENMRARAAADFDVNLNKVRSAFNCQAPGTETLSAEQIVVDHAMEQVKMALSCTDPLISDEEEVIESTAQQCYDRSPQLEVEQPVEAETAVAANESPQVDLLDLSDVLTMKTETQSQLEPEIQIGATTKPEVALLDLSDVAPAKVETGSVVVPDLLDLMTSQSGAEIQEASMTTFSANLMDVAEPALIKAEEKTPIRSVDELADLLDLREI